VTLTKRGEQSNEQRPDKTNIIRDQAAASDVAGAAQPAAGLGESWSEQLGHLSVCFHVGSIRGCCWIYNVVSQVEPAIVDSGSRG
jgi:hypothetical protein